MHDYVPLLAKHSPRAMYSDSSVIYIMCDVKDILCDVRYI